jgi:hypothetical protein
LKSFELLLRVLSCDIAVRCGDEASSDLLRECYSAFLLPAETEFLPALGYDVSLAGHAKGWTMRRDKTAIHCHNSYDLIYEFEKDMTVRVQLLRADLFFIHGAALSVAECCVIISGESGSGKSSLAWFMSHNGYDYLSDELAPVDPVSLQVEPYPHALCLKKKPLSEPALPDSTQYTDATIHVPAYELPTRALDRPCPLSFLIFVDGSLNGRDLVVRAIGSAESAARLYSNGLNQLSHRGDGLPVAVGMASGVSSYLMSGGTVEERAQAIRGLFDSMSVIDILSSR